MAEAHLVGADVLGDAAGFARGHVGFANGIEERGLAVIDMAHDRDHGGTGHFDHVGFVGFEHLFDGLVLQLLFVADDVGGGAELGRDILHHLGVEGLVDGDEDAAHEQRRDQVLGADLELLGQVLDADALGHRDFTGNRQRLLGEVGRPAKTARRDKALHRAFLGLGILLATAAATPGRRATRGPRRFAGRRRTARSETARTRAKATPGRGPLKPGRWPKPGRPPGPPGAAPGEGTRLRPCRMLRSRTAWELALALWTGCPLTRAAGCADGPAIKDRPAALNIPAPPAAGGPAAAAAGTMGAL